MENGKIENEKRIERKERKKGGKCVVPSQRCKITKPTIMFLCWRLMAQNSVLYKMGNPISEPFIERLTHTHT